MTAYIAPKSLPKRALREIERLRADVESWKKKALAAASTDPGATNVVLHNVLEPDQGLPPNSIIVFCVGRERFEVHPEGDRLVVRSTDGMLVVRPAASNTVYFTPEDRR